MKKHTKLLSLALVLVMALALFPAPAMAAEEPVNCVGATRVTDGRVTLELSNPIMAIAETVDDIDHDIYGVNGRQDLSPLYVVPAGTTIT